MGEVPHWYVLLSAAKYLGVNPWELAEAPVFWLHAAHASMYAEDHADKMKNKKK